MSSIEVREKIGTATVTVHWNVNEEMPEVAVDASVDSKVFPAVDCLRSLANASRQMADELDKKVEAMRGNQSQP